MDLLYTRRDVCFNRRHHPSVNAGAKRIFFNMQQIGKNAPALEKACCSSGKQTCTSPSHPGPETLIQALTMCRSFGFVSTSTSPLGHLKSMKLCPRMDRNSLRYDLMLSLCSLRVEIKGNFIFGNEECKFHFIFISDVTHRTIFKFELILFQITWKGLILLLYCCVSTRFNKN